MVLEHLPIVYVYAAACRASAALSASCHTIHTLALLAGIDAIEVAGHLLEVEGARGHVFDAAGGGGAALAVEGLAHLQRLGELLGGGLR